MPSWTVIAAAAVALVLLVLLVAWALREGREVSFWPPRIGARPHPPAALSAGTDPAVGSAALTNLPGRSYARLLGRSKELRVIVDMLADRASRQIVAICGLGGVGKTALAHEVADVCQRTDVFEELIWETAKEESLVGEEIRQQPRNAISVGEILRRIARRLGSEDAEVARQVLRSRRCLLIIDNIETIHDYRSFVAELAGLSLGGSRILITSRPQFSDYSEIFTVVLGGLGEAEGLELMRTDLRNRGQSQPGDDALRRIFTATGGAPLAMKLLAGQLGHLPVDEVIADLRTVESASTEAMYTFIYRATWTLLSAPARKVLLAMPAFPASADPGAIAHVSTVSGRALTAALRELVSLSILDGISQSPAGPRYEIHSLTRNFLFTELPGLWN